MAQAGYTPILIYASLTPGNTPSAANLTSSASGAELALNYADGKLFYKDGSGVVQTLATKGTGSIGGSNTQVQFNSSGSLAGSANMTFNGTRLTVADFADSSLTSGRVTYAGASGNLTDSANLTFDGTNLTLGGGTANGVAYLNGSKVLTTGSALQFNGTNLALGAGGQIQVFRPDNATYTTQYMGAGGTGGYVFDNRNADGFRWLFTGSEQMRLTSTGLGIGTSSPATKLEVSGSGAVARVSGTSGSVPQLSLSSAGVVNWTLRSNNDSGSDFTIYQDATQRLKIDSSGNVGIGTSSPATKLHLQDNSAVYIQMTDVGDGASRIGQNGTALTFGVDSANGATERARITSTGNVVAGGSVALATNATDGFLYVPTCAGTPTGTPTAITGMAPIVVNTTNNKLYFYSGGAWRDAGP